MMGPSHDTRAAVPQSMKLSMQAPKKSATFEVGSWIKFTAETSWISEIPFCIVEMLPDNRAVVMTEKNCGTMLVWLNEFSRW
jgi:hypothetical protein